MRVAAIVALAAAAVFAIVAAFWAFGPARPATPAVKGFYRGQEVRFIHTEVSDPQVAQTLSRMVASKVLVVPSLKDVPHEFLAQVFVFTNGVKGDGPFGFQPDVFDSIPGDPRYTPLRKVTLVTWKEGVKAQTLRSVEEVRAAAENREISLKMSGVVVNMPFLTWPGGRR